MKIKICGIKRTEDIETLNKLKPDYVGFVFAKSKRQIDKNLASKLRSLLDTKIKTVGVFVDADSKEIDELIDEKIIDSVQFHGHESESEIVCIKNKHPNTIVFKAVSVKSIKDILEWKDSKADFLLLDNGAGGTGEQFDWEILKEIKNLKKDFFIAGGLNPDNVKNVLNYKAIGVDVSGGVETDSVKDKEKIKKFIKNVREYND
ncbi:MAG: phosphoribosylanthranilate isomerase [Clostridia bacterium]